jgi:sulfur-oxidizing protein SoxX
MNGRFLPGFLLSGLVFSLTAAAEPPSREVEKVLQRDFHARGQATMDRVVQDGLQRLCTESKDRPPADVAKRMEADQMRTIAFPSGSLIGDWKKGEEIAQSGRGATWSDKAGAPAGGSCYNCHQLSPQEESHGTIGPTLRGFGKTRGNGPDMQRYVYGKIYNAKAYNACSHMPRLGYSGTLTEQQIKDLVGLLLDPASPVNQ